MALMQNAYKQQENTVKTWLQQGNMKLHAKLSKFHIEHASNGAMVQHIHSIQVSNTICPKHQLSTLQSRKQQATGKIWASTDYMLQITSRFRFIGIKIKPI